MECFYFLLHTAGLEAHHDQCWGKHITKYRVRVLQLPFEIRSDTQSLHLKYFVIELLFFVKIRNLLFLYSFCHKKRSFATDPHCCCFSHTSWQPGIWLSAALLSCHCSRDKLKSWQHKLTPRRLEMHLQLISAAGHLGVSWHHATIWGCCHSVLYWQIKGQCKEVFTLISNSWVRWTRLKRNAHWCTVDDCFGQPPVHVRKAYSLKMLCQG